MPRMPKPNLVQTIPKHKLIEACCKKGSRNVDKHPYPPIRLVGEGFGPIKERGDEAASEVFGEIGAHGYCREAPDHDAVCEADNKRSDARRDEGVCWVEDGPDDQALGRY